MVQVRFLIPLQGSSIDRYRHYHLLERGRIKEFVIQYEAEISGVWREIIRYDTAHGKPHKDILHPAGTESKEYFELYTHAEVLTFGQNDIRKNWKTYRQRFEKDMRTAK
jgi:hypothetical protein